MPITSRNNYRRRTRYREEDTFPHSRKGGSPEADYSDNFYRQPYEYYGPHAEEEFDLTNEFGPEDYYYEYSEEPMHRERYRPADFERTSGNENQNPGPGRRKYNSRRKFRFNAIRHW